MHPRFAARAWLVAALLLAPLLVMAPHAAAATATACGQSGDAAWSCTFACHAGDQLRIDAVQARGDATLVALSASCGGRILSCSGMGACGVTTTTPVTSDAVGTCSAPVAQVEALCQSFGSPLSAPPSPFVSLVGGAPLAGPMSYSGSVTLLGEPVAHASVELAVDGASAGSTTTASFGTYSFLVRVAPDGALHTLQATATLATRLGASALVQVRAALPPGPPQSLAFAWNGGAGVISISWTPGFDGGAFVTGYRVYRQSGTSWVLRGSSPRPGFNDSAAPSTSYNYRVTMLTGVGDSAPAEAATTTGTMAPPDFIDTTITAFTYCDATTCEGPADRNLVVMRSPTGTFSVDVRGWVRAGGIGMKNQPVHVEVDLSSCGEGADVCIETIDSLQADFVSSTGGAYGGHLGDWTIGPIVRDQCVISHFVDTASDQGVSASTSKDLRVCYTPPA